MKRFCYIFSIISLPLSLLGGELTIVPDEDFRPIEFKRPTQTGSALDLSGLQDAPAGKYGYIKNINGHFEFEKAPGKEIKLYGANFLFGANWPEKDKAAAWVDEYASIGYNFVRLHHYDRHLLEKNAKKCTDLHQGRLDRMDFLINELKKRGIYITFDLFSIRALLPDDIPGMSEADRKKGIRKRIFFDERVMNNWKKFSAHLLNHVNPYTGLAWKDDPAFVSICLVNEDTIYINADPKDELVKAKFAEWCQNNKVSIDEKNERRMYLKFLADIYREKYREMKNFLNQLGVKALLTDQNAYAGLPLTLMAENFDIVDGHTYIGHPVFKGGWGLPAGVMNQSATAEGGENFVFRGFTRIVGKPLTITELDMVNPNPHAMEGAFIAGAYGALQGWNGICHFAHMGSSSTAPMPIRFFDTAHDPVRILAERAAVLFFSRGDVQTSKLEIPLLLYRDYLDYDGYQEKNKGEENTYPILCQKLGLNLIGKLGTLLATPGEKVIPPDGAKFLLTAQERKEDATLSMPHYNANKLENFDIIASNEKFDKGLMDVKNGIFRSSTGEITMDTKKQTLQVITPNSEAFILPAGLNINGSFAKVDNQRGKAAFLIAAIDNKPLKSSNRILFLHLTEIKNSGMRFSDKNMTQLLDWGKLPMLMRVGKAQITLPQSVKDKKLYALDWDGSRKFEIPLKQQTNGSFCFTAENFVNNQAVPAYELTE
jgi:hypothetical protein